MDLWGNILIRMWLRTIGTGFNTNTTQTNKQTNTNKKTNKQKPPPPPTTTTTTKDGRTLAGNNSDRKSLSKWQTLRL